MSITSHSVSRRTNAEHASRRRGFGILSRLARADVRPAHKASIPLAGESVTDADYVPRHRRQDAQSATMPPG